MQPLQSASDLEAILITNIYCNYTKLYLSDTY